MSVTVLSLQSHVVQGTVGNSIAVPVMRAMGVRAWGMPTALLSNHNGRSSVAGIPIDSEQIDAMVNALDSNGELKHVDAVLSGYLTPRTGPAVLRTVERCRALHPDTIWVCDPVMGDMTPDGELRAYVPDETVSLMTDAVQHADVVVPNLAELGILTGTEPRTLDDIKAQKWAEIKSQRDRLEFGGFEFEGNIYDSDRVSQGRIMGAALAGVDQVWTLADNTIVELTASKLQQLYAALQAHIASVHERGRIARQLIFEAETKEQVEAIQL